MKDHYQTLEIGPKATTDEIKKSFRKLAHEYHPDKNPDNAFADARFRDIHEAYTVLNNEEKRALYDYERWLSGRFEKNAAIITPEYLLQEIDKLNAHIAQVDVYRMNKELLHQYLLFMFSDEKVAVLLLKGKPDTISGIISGTMKAALTLPLYFSIEILVRLKVIAANNLDDAERIELALQKLYRERIWQKLFPWLALAITIMLCMAMYFFSKK